MPMHDTRKHRIAALALMALIAASPLTPVLHAAEQPLSAQPESPLELAQRFESLTAGGPYNPMQPDPAARHPHWQAALEGDPPMALRSDHQPW
jgi:hypothetical protein